MSDSPVLIWAEPGRYGEKYELVLTPVDLNVDLSTTTAVVLRAREPDGTEHEWAASFAWDDTAQELTVTYAFEAGDNDVTALGMWSVYADGTLASLAPWRSRPRALVVRGRFAVVE